MKYLSIAGACALIMLCATSASAQQRYIEYQVKDGDTCASIAAEVYGDAARYDLIHEANDLGDPPHILKEGQTLHLPKVREALLRQERGTVMFKPPEADWSKAGVGLELYRAWRLNTLEQARALVEFRDSTELALRENTLVVIYGSTADRAQKRQTHARLESGALRARLGQLSGGPVTVETESAASDLAGGDALLTVDEGQATRVANHGGAPITVRGKAGGQVTVDEGFGSKVNRGERPKPPKPLPPTPGWQPGRTSFPTFGEATVVAAWDRVTEAKEYFVEVTADARGIQVIQAAFVPADVTQLEVQNLPPGDYFATVSAIDDDRFESIPSQRLKLQVLSFGFERALQLAEHQFLAGATIKAPPGMNCSVGGAEPASTFVLEPTVQPTSGVRFAGYSEEMTVGCVDAEGNASEHVAEAIIPAFEVQGPTVRDGQVIVPSGRAVSLDLVFDGQVPPLVVRAASLDASFLRVAPNRGRVRLVDTGEASATSLNIELAGQPLLEMGVTVEREPELTIIEPVHVEVGAAFLVQTGGSTLISPPTPGGGLATVRLLGRLLPSDYLSVGLIVDLGTTFSGENEFVAGVGGEAVGSIPFGRFRPFIGAGVEAWFAANSARTATFEGTLGFDVELFYAQGIRVAARAALMNEDVDWVAGLGGLAGYYWSF